MNISNPHPQAQTIADLSFRLDTCVALVASLAEQAGEAIELLAALSPKADAARPAESGCTQQMRHEDALRIANLHAKGHGLDALVAVTGFSRCQCFAVMVGRYQVLESGCVLLDVCGELAGEADLAAQWQRAGGADLWAVVGGDHHV